MDLDDIYEEANLSRQELERMPLYIDGSLDFFESSAYQKLYEYFAFETCEMPYGVAKCRTGTPDEWILEQLEK